MNTIVVMTLIAISVSTTSPIMLRDQFDSMQACLNQLAKEKADFARNGFKIEMAKCQSIKGVTPIKNNNTQL